MYIPPELMAHLIIAAYLLITLIICAVFDTEPIGAILWGLYPIIFPIIWLRRFVLYFISKTNVNHNYKDSLFGNRGVIGINQYENKS